MPALSSGATPGHDALGISASDMETFNATMAFDEALIDPVHGLPNIPFTPTGYDFETFSTTFEDPFSYPARPFDGAGVGPLDPEAFNFDAASPQELDSKLLGFGAPVPGRATLVTEDGRPVEPAMTGELYGMFFVAEDVFGADNNTGRPLELTCYRRNLWQCSAQITLPRNISHYVDDEGRQAPVTELAASITAVESIEGKATGLITIPWRNSNAALASVGGEETKVVNPPPVMTLDLSSVQEPDDSNRVTVPVSWKRLQFKHATANNGRRKGLQQHYVVQINLLVKAKNGEYIKVAEVQSGPVIVRGRSPRNFDNRREVPLTPDKRLLERRNTEGSTSAASASSVRQQLQQQSQIVSQDRPDVGNLQRYHIGNVQQSTTERERAIPRPLTTPNPQHPNKKIAMSSPNQNRPPIPAWGSLDASSNLGSDKLASGSTPSPLTSTSKSQRTASTAEAPQSLPISLPLSEDERSPNRSNSADSTQSPQLTKASMAPSSGEAGVGGQNQSRQAQNQLASPLETADMLYEYFPLSLDDWMPPVDAVYRPHVVHHTIVPPEVKAQQMRSKAKRYFVPE
ncbi:hypothetical protein VTK56DRAFT_2903 [Thermocarpiscus australiensis]